MRLKSVSQAPLILLVVFLLHLTGCKTAIQHDLEESEANEIVVLLEASGIAASKSQQGREGGWVVSVPSAEVSRAWQIMQDNGLPQRTVEGYSGVFGDGSLIPSPVEDRVRLQRALGGELEQTLLAIEGVIDARVHLHLPQEGGLSNLADDPAPGTASVLLIYRDESGESNCPIAIADVQELVAGSTSQVTTEDVAVIVVPRRTLATASQGDWAQVGPFRVAPESQSALTVVLICLAGVVVLLSTSLIVFVVRRRRVPVKEASR